MCKNRCTVRQFGFETRKRIPAAKAIFEGHFAFILAFAARVASEIREGRCTHTGSELSA